MDPVVSIIIPNYNHAPYLRERLRSVFAQTFADFEVILLDDASTDGSVEILREFASDERVAHLVVNERNGGSAFKQWRKGVALARGKWVWIAESDDTCAPDLLERLLEMNQREGDPLGLVFAQSKFIDEQGVRTGSMLSNTARFDPDPFKHDFVMDGSEFAVRYLKVKNFIPNVSAVILRRSCLVDERLWEGVENMRHCGDWLLWSRLLAGIRLGYLSEELNAFRDHSETTRRHTSTERKQRFLIEQSAVRSSLASYHGIDQSEEEGVMYDAWFRYFTYRELFSARLFSVRIHGRSRTSFLMKFLAFKWKMFKARRESPMSASEHRVTQTKNLPKVSVVITCFDLGAYLEEALESIAQYPITEHYEVVIVDDGSTDPLTLRVLSGLDSERYRIIRQQNMGLAKARNNGIRAAKGSYIIVLDADNRLRPAMFSHTIACLDADPSVDVVYGDLEYFDGKSRKMIIGGYDFGRLLRGNYIDACAGFRKSLWERLGGYDEHMPLMGFEDWDLWLRASVSGARFHYVNEVLFDYRVRKGSMLANANMSRSLLVDHLFNKPELRFLRDLRAEYYALHEAERTREVLTGRVLLRLLIQRLKDRFTGSVGEGTKRKTG